MTKPGSMAGVRQDSLTANPVRAVFDARPGRAWV
jgi:hypothetical protein